MRAIKFRAWDETQRYMAYQGTPDLETIQSFFFHWGDKKLMQYTGSKDKNGREIFEGDILEWSKSILSSGQIGWVEFICDGLGNGYFCINDYIKWNLNADKCSAQIIGNIYENPELIERKGK